MGAMNGVSSLLLATLIIASPPSTQSTTTATTYRPDCRPSPRFAWSLRQFRFPLDERAEAKRAEAILKLHRLVPTVPSGPQKAELIFRLAEMYLGRAEYSRSQVQHRASEAFSYDQEAMRLYEKLLTDYPKYKRKDEVLFNLGRLFDEAGEGKQGVKQYWELLKRFPVSDFGDDAWLNLAEYFFGENKLHQALQAYGKAGPPAKRTS